MNNIKLMETVAAISYMAGFKKHYTGNSRSDISEYISWAKEFEQIHTDTDWDYEDYMSAIEKYANERIKQAIEERTAFN